MRVILKPLKESEITDEYISWFSDPDVTRFLEVSNLTKKDCVDYLIIGKRQKIRHMYGIHLKDDDKLIGTVKIGDINHKHKTSSIVPVIGNKKYWNKGIGTQVITMATKIAFEKFNLRKLSNGMYGSNIGSLKAHINAGWTVEAILKDDLLLDGFPQCNIKVCCFKDKRGIVG